MPTPAKPTGMRATPQGATAILLEWNANALAPDTYKLYLSTDGTNFSELLSTDQTSLTIDAANGISDGVDYWFRVTAFIAFETPSDESDPSNAVGPVRSDDPQVTVYATAPSSYLCLASAGRVIDLRVTT